MSSQVISDDLSNIVQYIDQFPVQKEEDDVQSESKLLFNSDVIMTSYQKVTMNL